MGEPSRIRNNNLERVSYTSYEGQRGRAVVRKDRTAESTMAQYARILQNNPNLINENPQRYLQLADSFTRTLRAMDATGRSNPYGTMYRGTLNRR